MRLRVFILGFILVSFSSYAQKVKYKDLYILLRAKNYKDASGFLKSYLLDDPEHPNANYQMGLMLEHNLVELDLLKESDAIINRADSSILYFNRAHDYITEKEIKKHDDDFYELFKRRNLRTGKFEVIISDVHLDIEDRIKKLTDYKSDVASINFQFNNGVKYYELARLGYKKLKEEYKDELSLSLGALANASAELTNIGVQFDSSVVSFKHYKSLKKEFESNSTSINDVIITYEPIKEFSDDVLQIPDFYANKIDLYQFSDWSKNQIIKINSNKEFINDLIKFDQSLEKLANEIEEDSVDLSSEIFKKITSPILKELKFVDDKSLLTKLFQYKISQLNFNSIWMQWLTNYADTLDIALQLNFVDKLKTQLDGVTKLVERLDGYDAELFNLRYNRFISARFNTTENFEKYIHSQNNLVANEIGKVELLKKQVKAKDHWGYWHNERIPLSLNMDSLAIFNNFYVDSLEKRVIRVAGFKVNEVDTLFYMVSVPSTRKVDTLFQVQSPIPLVKDSLSYLAFSVHKTPTNENLFLVTNRVKESLIVGLIKATFTEGIIWSTAVPLLNLEPPTLTFEEDEIVLMQGQEVTTFLLSDGTLVVPELEMEEESN